MDQPNTPLPNWHDWLAAGTRRYLLFARSQARCEADAHDLLQEALVEVWRRGRGQPVDDALVYQTIRRRAIDLGRRNDRRGRRELAAAPVSWWEDAGEEHGLDAELENAVKTLPADLRDVVMLKVWGELTFRQVADALSLPPGTVASRYRQAVEQLRTLLREVRS